MVVHSRLHFNLIALYRSIYDPMKYEDNKGAV